MNLASITTDKLRKATKLREQIDALENELSKALNGRWPFVSRRMRNGQRNMTAEGKARIAAAQKKRWAAWRKKNK
jgi:hypothetical protein